LGLKDLNIRVRLPWKENPRVARCLYKQITRSDDPEEKAREIMRRMGK